jgi:undecaprenyl-diphosphatase
VTYTQGVVLGVIQGLTEFLPVSSSGHLILVPAFLGWPDQGLAFDAAIHLGTLGALVCYFSKDLLAMAHGFLRGGSASQPSRRLTLVLAAATVPAGIAGLLAQKIIEARFRAPGLVAASLIGWALVMWCADRRADGELKPTRRPDAVGWRAGLAVGSAQALALIPGTSRSGITITAGLLARMDRATAARFSFLLGIPITGAAGSAKTLDLIGRGLDPAQFGPLLAGLGAAFLSGWVAVWFLVNFLQRRSLLPFVLYRIMLGLVILLALGF